MPHDNWASALAESGDLLEAIAEGSLAAGSHSVEVGEVIAGTAVGRSSSDEITLFDSVGLGAQDLAVAARIIELAHERNLGVPVAVAPGSTVEA